MPPFYVYHISKPLKLFVFLFFSGWFSSHTKQQHSLAALGQIHLERSWRKKLLKPMWMLITMSKVSKQRELVLCASLVATGQCNIKERFVPTGYLNNPKIWIPIWIWNLDLMFLIAFNVLITLLMSFFSKKKNALVVPAFVFMRHVEGKLWDYPFP